jgi:hypothetical protein
MSANGRLLLSYRQEPPGTPTLRGRARTMTLIVVPRVRKRMIMWSSTVLDTPYDNCGPQSFASEVQRMVILPPNQNQLPDVYREVSDGTA